MYGTLYVTWWRSPAANVVRKGIRSKQFELHKSWSDHQQGASRGIDVQTFSMTIRR